MLKLFSKSKTIEEEQQQLFYSLEKIVNVALVKTERGDNQSVKEILKDLEHIFRDFWQLKKSNPEKFEALLWSKSFFEGYVRPLGRENDLDREDPDKTKSRKELEQEAALLLAFCADRELKGLTQFLDSFKKIWECAIENENDEISRYVVYEINWLLEELTQESSNDLFVEQFLRQLNSMTVKAIKSSDKGIDASVYTASIDWYIDTVFSIQKDRSFDLAYLDLFDKYFFTSIRYIISKNQDLLFEHLVSSLVDRVRIPSYNKGKIWDYWRLISESDVEKYSKGIIGRIEALYNSEKDLDAKTKRDEWLEKFEELKNMLGHHLSKEQKENVTKTEEEIRKFIDAQFKYNNLLEIVFAIGAFCLFKQRPEYIKHLWEYKQPPDSDAYHIGHDIVPNTFDGVVGFYLKRDLFERKFDFWEGHHGSEVY